MKKPNLLARMVDFFLDSREDAPPVKNLSKRSLKFRREKHPPRSVVVHKTERKAAVEVDVPREAKHPIQELATTSKVAAIEEYHIEEAPAVHNEEPVPSDHGLLHNECADYDATLLGEEEIKLLIREEVLRHWLEMGEADEEFDVKFTEAVRALLKDYGAVFFDPLIASTNKRKQHVTARYSPREVLDTLLDEMA